MSPPTRSTSAGMATRVPQAPGVPWLLRASSLEVFYNDEGQQRGGIVMRLAEEERSEAFLSLLRESGSGPINTHAVLGGLVVGGLEHALRESTDPKAGSVALRTASTAWGPAIAGLGDRVFDGTVSPLGSVAGLLLVSLVLGFGAPPLAVWLSELLLVAASVGYFLGQGFAFGRLRNRGRRGPQKIVEWLRRRPLDAWNIHGLAAARVTGGAVVGAWVVHLGCGLGGRASLISLVVLAVFAWRLRHGNRRPLRVAWVAAAIAGLLGFVSLGTNP